MRVKKEEFFLMTAPFFLLLKRFFSQLVFPCRKSVCMCVWTGRAGTGRRASKFVRHIT